MKQISVIGLGVSDKAQFNTQAQQAFEQSEIVIGADRQLAVVDDWLQPHQQLITLPSLSELKNWLEQHQDKTITVLASGDPLHYGIGRWLVRQFGIDRLDFYPAVSSVQAACHALGIALQDVEVLSLHGRPVEKIRSKLCKAQQLVVLTDKHSQPAILAQACIDAGFAESTLWVCEMLGYPQQCIRQFSPLALIKNTDLSFDPLHVTVIQTKGRGGVLPEFPGIEDASFITGSAPGKGMITKREVRLSILSLMQPSNNDVIWDIGAGCGSVAVELAYWRETAQIYAIDHG
ncbi:MAG: precorrin-6y C5,15-methyltransferase (decarboxylating) subunit CbiE [Algicola sp.]|nr:precorrin-6y C5,15-methyltransferase (decarboxylating) subunit CbiE [Algicola sp.]